MSKNLYELRILLTLGITVLYPVQLLVIQLLSGTDVFAFYRAPFLLISLMVMRYYQKSKNTNFALGFLLAYFAPNIAIDIFLLGYRDVPNVFLVTVYFAVVLNQLVIIRFRNVLIHNAVVFISSIITVSIFDRFPLEVSDHFSSLIPMTVVPTLVTYFNEKLNHELISFRKDFYNHINILRGGSEQVKEVANELISKQQEFARAIVETAAAVEQMRQSNRVNVENLDTAFSSLTELESSVSKSNQLTIRMNQKVAKTSDDFERLNETHRSAEQHFKEVVARIGDIEAQTNSVKEIVRQTQILSFNAAIEAQNASSQGKGFAIISQRIRELANTCQEAAIRIENSVVESASSISELSDQIKVGFQEISATMNKSFEDIRSNVSEFDLQFSQVVDVSVDTKGAIQKVMQSSEMESLGHDQIHDSMESIRQTSAALGELSQSLQDQILTQESTLQSSETFIASIGNFVDCYDGSTPPEESAHLLHLAEPSQEILEEESKVQKVA